MQVLMDLVAKQQRQIAEMVQGRTVSVDLREAVEKTNQEASRQLQIENQLKPDQVGDTICRCCLRLMVCSIYIYIYIYYLFWGGFAVHATC